MNPALQLLAAFPHISLRAQSDERIWITGAGLITPLGATADETWRSLLEGRRITKHSPLLSDRPDRVTDLAESAAREAIAGARWGDLISAPARPSNRIGLVVGTSKGPAAQWLSKDYPQSHNRRLGDSGFGLASVASELSARLVLRDGPRLTLSAACASGLHALIRAVIMMQSGEAERAIVVAAEGSVHPLFVGSFNRLGVLPPQGAGCRPFDEHRKGFLMSDAAAAVCIEKAYHPPGRGERSKLPPIVIEAMGLAGDAMHLTSGDPAGRTMNALLTRLAGERPINLFHAHGTGTPQHDAAELAAINACAGAWAERPAEHPLVYSHKAALGHSLGAAGLVGIVISCYCHAYGVVPPNVNTAHPLKTSHVRISPSLVSRPVRRSITFAAGFGGPMAGIVLSSEQKANQPNGEIL